MIRAMLRKEFLLILRDRHALAALFVMPAVFILIMTLALKDFFTTPQTLARYAVIDLDHSGQSRRLTALLKKANGAVVGNLPANQEHGATARLFAAGTRFILTIPPGFGKPTAESAATAPRLEIDVAPEVKPDLLALFKGQVSRALVALRLERLAGTLAARAPAVLPLLGPLKQDPAALLRVRYGAGRAEKHPTAVQQNVPAWIVFGMFFIIIPMSTIFVDERKQNTLMRLQAMNVSMPVHFVGKIIPYLVINQLQVWVMFAVGMFVMPWFGAAALSLGNSFAALLLISLALSLAAIGLSMLIAVLVETVEQATTIGGIINILLGAIGGVMVPKFIMPLSMQKLTVLSPMSWGLEGFLDILLRGEGVAAILGKVLALVVFAGVSLGAAAVAFKLKRRWTT